MTYLALVNYVIKLWVIFDKNNCIIENVSDRKVLFVEMIICTLLNDFPTNDKCLSALLYDNSGRLVCTWFQIS